MDLIWWLLAINAIAGILIIELELKKCKPLMNIDEERDSKIPPFRRLDTHNWKRWRFYPGAMTIMIPRVIIGVSSLAIGITIICLVMGTGTHLRGPRGLRAKIIDILSKICHAIN